MQNGLTTEQADELRRLKCQGQRGRYPWICCASGDNAATETTSATPQSVVTSSRRRQSDDPNATSDAGGSRGGAVAAYGACGREAFGQKIYGGNETGLNEFPWMALVQYRHSGMDTNAFA